MTTFTCKPPRVTSATLRAAPTHRACTVRPSPRLNSSTRRVLLPLRCSGEASAQTTAKASLEQVKSKLLSLAACTDRGQRMNPLVAPAYQEEKALVAALAEEVIATAHEVDEAALSGDWVLVYSDVEPFRSSPFFLAIEEAFDNSQVNAIDRGVGIEDAKEKSPLFFKLHQLQVMSWGVSTVGKITQSIDFEEREFESSFDTTLFGLTVIPIVGWFKLLPTFAGRVVTVADKLKLTDRTLRMELQKTQVVEVPGAPRVPLVDKLLMDRWYPVNAVWQLLPWNKGPPTCSVEVEYVDADMRIMRDARGGRFIYTRPVVAPSTAVATAEK